MRYTRWNIKADPEGMIWIWANGKFLIFSKEIMQVKDYLLKFIKPNDDIFFIGFTDKTIEVKGKQLLKGFK